MFIFKISLDRFAGIKFIILNLKVQDTHSVFRITLFFADPNSIAPLSNCIIFDITVITVNTVLYIATCNLISAIMGISSKAFAKFATLDRYGTHNREPPVR